MKKNFQIRGGFMVEVPKPFRRQQLALEKHYKDKQIRRELEQLQRKRQLDIRLEAQWKIQKKTLQDYTKNQQEQNAIFKEQQKKLQEEMFRLETRKQQIESRTNPQIVKENGKKLMQYLRCVPYTAGSRLDKIVFWGGEKRYFNLKFLIEYGLDRFLRKSFVQRSISSNLQRTVFCSRAELNGQQIMISVKQIFDCQNVSDFTSESNQNRSSLFSSIPFKEASYELVIYSITGQYFCLRKVYTYKEIFCWSSLLDNKDKIAKSNKPRLSVAETLAKQNALKQLANKRISEISSQENSSTLQLKTMEAIKKQSSETLYNTSLPIAYEHQNEHSCVNLARTEIWQQNLSEQSEVSGSSNNSSRNPSEEHVQTEQEEYEEQSYLVTKKTYQSKSSFFPNSNSFKRSTNKLVKPFLGGRQATLFPKASPLQNIVILQDKKQIYILSEYLNLADKKQLMQRAISRFRLKIQLKKQLKKCLFYRVMEIDQFDETKFFITEQIKVPFLFTIKEYQSKDCYELRLNCCSIKHHPFIQKAVDISVVFHKEQQKAEAKEVRIQRVSNMKMSPKTSQLRRSRDTKRKSSARMVKKQFHQLHQKSSFNSAKKGPDRFKPFSVSILEKFQSFLQTHTISLCGQRFLSYAETATKLKSIILIQKNYKRFLQRRRYKDGRKYQKNTMRYFRNSKVFFGSYVTCEDELVVFIESLSFGRSSQCLKLTYPKQYLGLIDGIIRVAKDEGALQVAQAQLRRQIDQAILKRLDRQKPEKSKEKIRNFLNMYTWRLRAKENIFYIKKIKVKERMFFLLIRRDTRVRSVLQCSLYDFLIHTNQSQHSKKDKDAATKTEVQKIQQLLGPEEDLRDMCTRNERYQKMRYYRYQQIYLHQNYFNGIERKSIIDEFLIDHKIFLLKPAKTSSVYYIERLNFLDINSDQVTKEFISLQKEQMMYAKGISSLYSNSSIKGLKNQSYANKSYLTPDPLGSNLKLRNTKKNSIEDSCCLGLDILINQSLVKQIIQPIASKASLTDSSSVKHRKGYTLKGNSHKSLIYYSLYKSIDIFFYLDLYIIKLTPAGKTYTQSLIKVHSQRLYKKQLQDMEITLIYKKTAEWLRQNQEEYLLTRQIKELRQLDKTEGSPSSIDVDEGMNIFNQCLQLIDSNNTKRFSHGLQRNRLSAGEKQKGSRNNTLTL